MTTHSSIPVWRILVDTGAWQATVWRILVDTGAWQATVHGVAELDTTERLSTAQHSVVSKGMGHRYKPSRRTPQVVFHHIRVLLIVLELNSVIISASVMSWLHTCDHA